ncbi:MAG: hypothetical protein R3E35_00875 [Rhodocyclaceae bacterium]
MNDALTRYIDSNHVDARERARARRLQVWLRSDLTAPREERPTAVIFRAPVDKPLSEAGHAPADKLIRVAVSLIEEGADNLFDNRCIADTEPALTLDRRVANGDAVPENLRRYVQAQWARPPVQARVRHDDAERRGLIAAGQSQSL